MTAMNDVTSTGDLSRGVGKSGQELGLENELILLNCIKIEGWVRENEASCSRRLNIDPPCRLNIDPGPVAVF
jgi:hypothetical protein